MLLDKLFFIYVAKNSEWQKRQAEDWDYVSSMSRFYKWWIKRYFNVDFTVEADILPVIPGHVFDRMSVNYLARDHSERGNLVYHFYLAYFKPLWTDCNTEGYSGENFGMVYWERPKAEVSNDERERFFIDTDCAKVSHLLSHEILRMKGKKKKEYFEAIHELWDKHTYSQTPFLYFNSKFEQVKKSSPHRFITIDPTAL